MDSSLFPLGKQVKVQAGIHPSPELTLQHINSGIDAGNWLLATRYWLLLYGVISHTTPRFCVPPTDAVPYMFPAESKLTLPYGLPPSL